MFSSYVPAVKFFYTAEKIIHHRIVKFYFDKQHEWEDLANKEFPNNPRILKQLKEIMNGQSI